ISESMAHSDYGLASAAVRLTSHGKKEEASDVLARVEDPSALVSALQPMAMSDLAGGNNEDALSLLDQGKETCGESEHNEERIRTICEIGNHFVEAGRNDLAIGAYDTAKEEAEKLDNIHRDSFLAAAVMGFLHVGNLNTADRTLDLVTDKTQ